jgi:thymidine kinase
MSQKCECCAARRQNGLVLIKGPMYSGKTTELRRLIRMHTVAERHCAVVKYSQDTRYVQEDEQLLSTHDSDTMPALPYDDLAAFERTAAFYEADVIGIDEGQFFEGIAQRVDGWVNEKGKLVIVTALSSTFERKPWPEVNLLSAYCTEEVRLHAVCTLCKDPAPFTERTTGAKEEKVIGGKEMYRALCGRCYHRNKSQ